MGFGRVEREDDEPVFHYDWERRVFALNIAGMGLFGPVDRARHAIERLEPAAYLNASYYERWLTAIEMLAKEFGVLSEEEIHSGVVQSTRRPPHPPANAEIIASLVAAGMPATRQDGRQQPKFDVGDRVRSRNLHPYGHSRLPGYVRGRIGVIERVHGTHVFPDTFAHDQGENPQPLYNVKFAACELWGSDAPRHDYVYVDLWEDYLVGVDQE
jgi:nitrile hydratase beta subunit